MYSFYGGKQGRTYNIVQRFDEIVFDKEDTELYPSYSEIKKDQGYVSFTQGQKFNYGNEIYLVLPFEQDAELGNEITIEMPEDIGTKVILLKGMVNQFKKGGSYTDVNYGQYVIIDTILNENHKNDDINGCLYRRGFDYTEDASSEKRPSRIEKENRTFTFEKQNEETFQPEQYSFTFYVLKYHLYDLEKDGDTGQVIIYHEDGDRPRLIDLGFDNAKWNSAWRAYIETPGGGAIYVGQIVGPQGNTPQLVLKTWEDFQEDEQAGFAYQPTAKLQLVDYPGIYQEQTTTEQDQPIIQLAFNDNVEAAYYNTYDKDANSTGAVLSFKFPRTVFRFTGKSISPYGETVQHYDLEDEFNGSEPDQVTYERKVIIDPQTEQETITDDYENLIHEHTKREGHKHPFYRDFQVAIPRGIKGNDADIFIENTGTTAKSELYLSKSITDYHDSAVGTQTTSTLSPYRVIDNITPEYPPNQTAAASDLRITYTQGNDTIIPLKNVSNVEFDRNSGQLKVSYSEYKDNTGVITTADAGTIETIRAMRMKGDLIQYLNYPYDPNNEGDEQHWQTLGTPNSAYHIQGIYNSKGALPSEGFLKQSGYQGWCAAVTTESGTEIYAYDYHSTPNEWKLIYTFENTLDLTKSLIVMREDDVNLASTINALNQNGIIFLTSVGQDDITQSV